MTDFTGFPKIARYSREVVVTEKIDGTNAQVYITEDGDFLTGSRTRWITPEDDNYGFSAWAHLHRDELMALGKGHHFGEWWGQGIQRKYGLAEKRFSLFNISLWEYERPECCHVVPVLWRGMFDDLPLDGIMYDLERVGSEAAPGFMRPEGIVIYHTAGKYLFKKTFQKDEKGKGEV